MTQLFRKKIAFVCLGGILSFSSLNAGDDFTEIKANHPGAIMNVFVQVGQFVPKGTLLFEGDVMKMRFNHRAPRDGFVTLLPNSYDRINTGDLLCVLSSSPILQPSNPALIPPRSKDSSSQSPPSQQTLPTVCVKFKNTHVPPKERPTNDHRDSQHAAQTYNLQNMRSLDSDHYTVVMLSTSSATPPSPPMPPHFPFEEVSKKTTPQKHHHQKPTMFERSLSWVEETFSTLTYRVTQAMSLPHLLSEQQIIQWAAHGITPPDPETLMITQTFPKTFSEWQQFLENLLAFNMIAFSGFSHVMTRGLKRIGRSLQKIFLSPLRIFR